MFTVNVMDVLVVVRSSYEVGKIQLLTARSRWRSHYEASSSERICSRDCKLSSEKHIGKHHHLVSPRP